MRAKAAFLILILLAVLPQVSFAVQPLCKDFEEIPGDASTYQGSSYNSLYYAQDGRWDRWFQAPTNYNPFHSAALGAHCANNWHYDDLDGDGTTEAYLLTGEPFTVWFNAYADSARDVLGRDAHFGSFNVISFDERWNNGPAYPCPDNPDDPKDFSLSYCTSNNVSVAVEKIYTTPQKTLMTPPVFGFLEVSLGAPIWKQWFAYGWASFPLKYKDEKGNERNYLVLNCAADQDCGSSGKCIKPTADPLENFCASPSGSEMILKTDSVYSTDLPADNVIPYDSASEICKQFNSESENTRLVSLSAIGFNKGPSLLNARVYSDNNNVPGELLASASTYAKITGTAHEESVVFENPVSVKGKFWVCLNSRSSNEYGYLSFNYSTPHTFYFESGNLRPAHSSRDYAIRAKVKIYTPPVAEDLDSSPAINPFILKSGDSADSGGESGGQREKNFAVPALVFAGILGAAYLVARPLKINSWIPRITPIFPTEKNSITPRGVNNNAIRRQIAGKYLSGFGNAGAADKIANWLPGGQYFNAKQKYGEEYARTQEAADRKRWDDGMKLLWKDAAVGGSAKNILPNLLFENHLSGINKSKLIENLKSLPFGKPIPIGREIFEIVDFQPTEWGLLAGAKKVYRGNLGDVNLELREFPDGSLTVERDHVDPRPEKAKGIFELLFFSWPNHITKDILKIRELEKYLPSAISSLLREGGAIALGKYGWGVIKDVLDDLIGRTIEHISKFTKGISDMAEGIMSTISRIVLIPKEINDIIGENVEAYNSGKKDLVGASVDTVKNSAIETAKAVAGPALFAFSKVLAIGWVSAAEFSKWGMDVIGSGYRAQWFLDNKMSKIDKLYNKILLQIGDYTNYDDGAKLRYLKEGAEEKLAGVSRDVEKLRELYYTYKEDMENVEAFMRGRQEGFFGGISNGISEIQKLIPKNIPLFGALHRDTTNSEDYENFKRKHSLIQQILGAGQKASRRSNEEIEAAA